MYVVILQLCGGVKERKKEKVRPISLSLSLSPPPRKVPLLADPRRALSISPADVG